MDYKLIYDLIITKAQYENRKKKMGIYYEKHHILPKSMNGTNDEINLVLLTAKEHYVCHKLLLYIYPKNKSMIYAFYRLSFDKKHKVSSRDYAKAKELFNSIPKTKSKEAKKNMSKAKKGRNYKSLFGKKSKEMKKLRSKESSGAGNGMAKKYVFINTLTNEYWFCCGNTALFCKKHNITSNMIALIRHSSIPVRGWKREIFDNKIHTNIKVF